MCIYVFTTDLAMKHISPWYISCKLTTLNEFGVWELRHLFPYKIKHSPPCKVILTLASLLFNRPSLCWEQPSDHLEAFAGVCSISNGEWKEGQGLRCAGIEKGVLNIP